MAGMNVEPRPPNGNGAYGAHRRRRRRRGRHDLPGRCSPSGGEHDGRFSVSEIMAQTEELPSSNCGRVALHTQPVKKPHGPRCRERPVNAPRGSSAELRFWRIAFVSPPPWRLRHCCSEPTEAGRLSRPSFAKPERRHVRVIPIAAEKGKRGSGPRTSPWFRRRPSRRQRGEGSETTRLKAAFARKNGAERSPALARRRVASAHRHRFIAKDTVVFSTARVGYRPEVEVLSRAASAVSDLELIGRTYSDLLDQRPVHREGTAAARHQHDCAITSASR